MAVTLHPTLQVSGSIAGPCQLTSDGHEKARSASMLELQTAEMVVPVLPRPDAGIMPQCLSPAARRSSEYERARFFSVLGHLPLSVCKHQVRQDIAIYAEATSNSSHIMVEVRLLVAFERNRLSQRQYCSHIVVVLPKPESKCKRCIFNHNAERRLISTP